MELLEGKMAGTLRPGSVSTRRTQIATLAKQMPGTALQTLAHHMDAVWMHEAHRRTRKDGAVGIDGETAGEYATALGENLQGLLDRAKSGTYRAPPVRRVHIPKGDGSKTRPIGIPTFEDKVLQRAVAMLLEPVYEEDFYDFSYGFRPGRSAHDAVDALQDGLKRIGAGWVLDVDVQSFFDTIDHEQLRNLLQQRIADGVVVRLVGKWLRAGVLEGGVISRPTMGTPQGGVISPLLANIYLHEVLDDWWVKEVQPRLSGRSLLVRYADDFVMAFSDREDAFRVQEVLGRRFARFGLTLHPEKTRLVPFRRPRKGGGGPRPGSFDFLGFTFYWSKPRTGWPVLKRKTAKDRFTRSLRKINKWLRANRHLPPRVQSQRLGPRLQGHFNYYGVRGNSRSLNRFHYEVRRLWKKWLSRRSQRSRMTWPVFNKMLARYPLPSAKVRPRTQPAGRQLALANL